MKNLFLALAFVLATSFSFAGGCFNFILSCGIEGVVCGSNTGDMIDLVLFVDGLLC